MGHQEQKTLHNKHQINTIRRALTKLFINLYQYGLTRLILPIDPIDPIDPIEPQFGVL